jgi:hypothetical protein
MGIFDSSSKFSKFLVFLFACFCQSNLFKNLKSFSLWVRVKFTFQDSIHKLQIVSFTLGNSNSRSAFVLIDILICLWISLILMFELATRTVRTVQIFMESLTKSCLVVLWDISFEVEFMMTMSERASLCKDTSTSEFPIFTHFSLVLCPKAFNILGQMFLRLKYFFRFFN